MRARDDERQAELSVLDRLLWQENRINEIGRRGDDVLSSIARDLEVLMNSRRADDAIPEEYPEVTSSILNFGMPALGRYGHIGTAAEQGRLCRSMESAVRTFEPRLRLPRIRVKDVDGDSRGLVRFTLEATVDGLGNREIFELRVKPATGEMTVTSGGGE